MVDKSTDKTNVKCTMGLIQHYNLLMLGVTLLAVKRSDNLAVNCSTEETICASGRLASCLYPSCSTG